MEISAAMIKPGCWIAFYDSSIQERGFVWGRVITQEEASRRKGYVSLPPTKDAIWADSWDIDDNEREVGWLKPESIVRLSTERDGPDLVPVYCASCEETVLVSEEPDFLCSKCRELQST